MAGRKLTPADLVYAATARCPCGAGLAYERGCGGHGSWDCSAILLGEAIPQGQPGAVTHTDRLPFAFWKVKSEDQPLPGGVKLTTRPAGSAPPEPLPVTRDPLFEQLAAIEHERWADWQRYMHGMGTRNPDGSLTIPADLVARWDRQIATPYAALSAGEQESDREQVRRYWPLVAAK